MRYVEIWFRVYVLLQISLQLRQAFFRVNDKHGQLHPQTPTLHPFPFPLSITPSWHLQSVPTPWHVQNPPPMGPASPALSHLDTEVGVLETPHHARSTTLQLRSNCLPSQTSRHPDRCGFGASRHPSNQPVLHDGIRLIGNCSLDSSGIFHSSSAGPLREHLTTQDVLVPVPGTGVLPAPRVPCQQQLVCHNSSAWDAVTNVWKNRGHTSICMPIVLEKGYMTCQASILISCTHMVAG